MVTGHRAKKNHEKEHASSEESYIVHDTSYKKKATGDVPEHALLWKVSLVAGQVLHTPSLLWHRQTCEQKEQPNQVHQPLLPLHRSGGRLWSIGRNF